MIYCLLLFPKTCSVKNFPLTIEKNIILFLKQFEILCEKTVQCHARNNSFNNITGFKELSVY